MKALPLLLCTLFGLTGTALSTPVERLEVEVLAVLPHAPDAFTQGLLVHQGRFYESSGRYGRSSLRELEPASGEELRRVDLADSLFGEGLALVEDWLIQLTWREGVALVYRLDDFALIGVHQYGGEGWGLCYDGEALWMSDGSAALQRRDAVDFSLLERVEVTLDGEPQYRLNELACVGEHVYANVWHDHRILRIHKASGRVDAVIDAAALLPLSRRPAEREAVLNGIAHDPAQGVFYLTGKLWPRLFKVRFVPEAE
ncbi:glutaminyl-peptide cyclotransferase [Zobellella sp. DQSA1]|uniref:glutaminyl-peptide cyclotransferase n=1 Tax=Zobellella sp. DQSA1 TaxID=3342386 RepID=UPI0035BF55EA